MKLGDRATITRRFTPEALMEFARSSGTEPDGTVPAPMIGALFSALLGVKLPGPGTNYLKQDLAFLAPVPAGATLTASVEVTRLRPDKHLVDLDATCHDESGRLVCHGRSLVLFRDPA